MAFRRGLKVLFFLFMDFVNNLLTKSVEPGIVKSLTHSKKNLTFFKISVIINIESKERKKNKKSLKKVLTNFPNYAIL